MTSQEDSPRIIEAINKRASNPTCPLCGSTDFTLTDGVVQLEVTPFHTPRMARPMPRFGLSYSTLPSATLVCQTCGNTLFINLLVLGLKDILEVPVTVNVRPVAGSGITANLNIVTDSLQLQDKPPARPARVAERLNIGDET
jgi:hypothetical protein